MAFDLGCLAEGQFEIELVGIFDHGGRDEFDAEGGDGVFSEDEGEKF